MHNHGRLTELAEILERADEGENFKAYLQITPHNMQAVELGFDMDVWFKQEQEDGVEVDYAGAVLHGGCDTVCCIGGTANFVWSKDRTRGTIGNDWQAKELLGLEWEEGEMLFYPRGYWLITDQRQLAAANAAKVIRHLIATGIVDWGITGAERRDEKEDFR